ncbi:Fic family protein [Pontiella sulfatireligans]|nr:Fic family protein [Pontiella sulfatireligans]
MECLGVGDLPCHCTSHILESGSRKTVEHAGKTEEYYTKSYAPGDSIFDQMVFALKYEGINLLILKKAFEKTNAWTLTDFIQSTPTGRYHRKLWYLYENLTGKQLDLPDLTKGNYIDLIDPKKFFVAKPTQVQRQRINDNLLGDFAFSPTVRRTPKMEQYLEADFGSKCKEIIDGYPPELIRDALAYLYTQETRSSYRIEQESLSGNKQERFMQLLREADSRDYLSKPGLIELQKKVITDPRYHREDYRDSQEYVGSSALTGDVVHLVPPKPLDLDELMEGLFNAAHRMMDSDLNPVVIAAIIAFGFVYIHPFKDGNGRIHRFLIHHILSRMGFTPQDFVFPVSAVMYQNAREYQDTLNLFSEPLLQLVDYSLDHEGAMTVRGDTVDYYRYFDATGIVENLFSFISDTIDSEYLKELDFLKRFADAKNAVEQIVDGMSQREARIFVENCKANGYKLSKAKREKFFNMLADDEICTLELAVQEAFEE